MGDLSIKKKKEGAFFSPLSLDGVPPETKRQHSCIGCRRCLCSTKTSGRTREYAISYLFFQIGRGRGYRSLVGGATPLLARSRYIPSSVPNYRNCVLFPFLFCWGVGTILGVIAYSTWRDARSNIPRTSGDALHPVLAKGMTLQPRALHFCDCH